MKNPLNIFQELLEKRAAKKQKEFLAKLKYGENWHHELYPHRYTEGSGPR